MYRDPPPPRSSMELAARWGAVAMAEHACRGELVVTAATRDAQRITHWIGLGDAALLAIAVRPLVLAPQRMPGHGRVVLVAHGHPLSALLDDEACRHANVSIVLPVGSALVEKLLERRWIEEPAGETSEGMPERLLFFAEPTAEALTARALGVGLVDDDLKWTGR